MCSGVLDLVHLALVDMRMLQSLLVMTLDSQTDILRCISCQGNMCQLHHTQLGKGCVIGSVDMGLP